MLRPAAFTRKLNRIEHRVAYGNGDDAEMGVRVPHG